MEIQIPVNSNLSGINSNEYSDWKWIINQVKSNQRPNWLQHLLTLNINVHIDVIHWFSLTDDIFALLKWY